MAAAVIMAGLALPSPWEPAVAGFQPSAATAPLRLEPGSRHSRELPGGTIDAVELSLESGQVATLRVDQRDVDVAVRCSGPDGAILTDTDGRENVVETISLIAERAGIHRCGVRAAAALTTPRQYSIALESVRPVEPRDRIRGAAERAATEGKRQYVVSTADALRIARGHYEKALGLWREAGDRLGEGDAVAQLGTIALLLGDPRTGLELLAQGLVVFRAIGDEVGQAAALGNIAAAHSAMGEKQRAIEHYEEGLAIARAAADRSDETVILGNLGVVHHTLGNPAQALAYANDALALARARGDSHWEAQALSTTAGVYSMVGDNERAIELFRSVVERWRDTGNRRGEAIATANIGTAYLVLGDARRAQTYLQEGARLLHGIGDRRSAAQVLVSVGRSHEQLGELPRAIERLEEALAGARAVSDRRAEAIALTALGHVYAAQALADRARETYEQALSLIRPVGDRLREAVILSELGTLSYERREWAEAAGFYTQSLARARAASDRNGEAAALLNLGRSRRMQGQLPEARADVESAMAIVESLRGRVSSPELRATYLAAKRGLYETYVDLLMRFHAEQPAAGFDAQALQAAERARARSLLELLVEARADIRRGAEPRLLEQERALSQTINAKAARQMAFMGNQQTEQQARPLSGELESLLDEYQSVQARIRATSPRYAALTQPEPLTVPEIRRQVLDADTILLEYALGDERSYAWILSATRLESVELPGRAEIEVLARRFYAAAAARPSPATDSAVRDAAYELSRVILAPLASSITGRRLLIVADGALQFVPFGALPFPATAERHPPTTSGSRLAPPSAVLLDTHEIVMLPSASALAVLRRELAGRPPPPDLLAVLADPVFHAEDRRVGRRADPGAVPPTRDAASILASSVDRAAEDVGIEGGRARLPRLPFSRREAESILARAPRGRALRALDFAASRATALDPSLGRHRFVHFATHGLLNATHPELSGLVLSLVDERGHSQDGFLRLHEIYNLELAADLVVLSACRTGLGREVRGEGLVGLTRGFMYAGAARVVVSLWTVDDEATAALMARFYARMLGSESIAPADALRRAQLDLANQPRWRAPYYWAGFVLQGEYRRAGESAGAPAGRMPRQDPVRR